MNRSEPDRRGTFSILRSCVLTLALCVYTALHLNIPPQSSGAWSVYLSKAQWVVIGMFAPELVVFTAWCQRVEATRLSKDLHAIFTKKASLEHES